MPTDDRGMRDAGDEPAPLIAPVGDRWAVIVGISRYQDSRLDLRYPRRDAEELARLLRTPEGGNFHPDRIRLLVDEEATTRALTRALRGFLMAALPEDLVLLYFACHGGPDPRRQAGALYLYTHDTDPVDVAGTGLPMDDIDRCLHEVVRAERAVIVVDTCHSGGVGGGLRATGRAEATNRYLEALARARGGVALLSSAEASEASEEDERWGGGHGVFTHFLLDGMRGAADGYRGTRDGIVSLGELFEYVREKVQNATDGRQHPAIGATAFDRGLPMAVTAELDVEQHLTLARGLYEVGWRLDDPAPFLLAARQFALAADLKRHLPRADVGRGCALLAAGRAAEAAQVLSVATTMAPDEVDADAWLYLGIALAEQGQWGPAAQAFREHVRRAPTSDEAGWAAAYADWLDGAGRPHRRRALLLGVGAFAPDSGISTLPGAGHDVHLMRDTLARALDIAPQDIQLLVDAHATRASVLEALGALRADLDREDVVVVYFTGHSIDTAGLDDPYLITSDAGLPREAVGISVRELMDALDLPAREVVLVLDTHVSPALVQCAQQAPSGRLSVLLGCGVGEVAVELSIGGQAHGLFTYALAQTLTRGEAASYGDLIDAVRAETAQTAVPHQQTAQLIGSRSGSAFAGRFPAADLWRAGRRRTVRPDQVEHLRRRRGEVPAPLADWALGCALLEQGVVDGGRQELIRARDALHDPHPDLWTDLAVAALDCSDRAAAVDALRAAVAATRADGPAAAALTALTARAASTPTVLVVGADPPDVALGGADLVPQIADALASTLGIAAGDVVTVAGPAAARTRILDEAAGLARRADDRLALLVVLGAAARRADERTLLVRDGVLSDADLSAALGGVDNLVTVLDVLPTLATAQRDVAIPVDVANAAIALPGTVTVTLFEADVASSALTAGALTGRPLRALLTALPDAVAAGRTYREWVASTQLPPPATLSVHGSHLDEPVLEDRSPMIAARRHLSAARSAAAAETARCAAAEIDRREARHEPHPEGYLQHGLALEVCQRPAEALTALRTARNLYEDESVRRAELRRDPAAGEWLRQARYHYGRLQFEHGDDLNEAVAALRAALRQDRDDLRARRMLAQAIRALVERESLVEAAEHLVRYVNGGAPLGMASEMVEFLNQRRRR